MIQTSNICDNWEKDLIQFQSKFRDNKSKFRDSKSKFRDSKSKFRVTKSKFRLSNSKFQNLKKITWP